LIPYSEVFELGPTLLASDTVTLAHATTLRVGLVKEAFTPGDDLAIGDLVLADFDGYAAKTPVPGTQPSGLDPASADFKITISPPAGGWRWETTGLTNLPQTIFGYIIYQTSGPTLRASALLPSPIELTGINQEVLLPSVDLTFLQGMIT